MHKVKKYLAWVSALTVAGMAGATMMASAATANALHDQTVISRDFTYGDVGSVNEKTWQTEKGAVVSFDNLTVVNDGAANEDVLAAGIPDSSNGAYTQDETTHLYTIPQDKQKDGSIVYKLNIAATTKDLAIGMVYRSFDATNPIKVYVSSTDTFSDTAATTFDHGTSDDISPIEIQHVAINASGTDTAVYVKIVIPYFDYSTTTNWICKAGISRLILSPEISASLHTKDTNTTNIANNIASPGLVVNSDFTTAKSMADYTPWGAGLYAVGGRLLFKTDSDNYPLCVESTWDDNTNETGYMIWKFNTVSAMDSATINLIFRAQTQSGYSGDSAPYVALSYSFDNSTYTQIAKYTDCNDDKTAKSETLDSAALNGATTLYVKVELMTPSWADWSWLRSLTVSTAGENPTQTVATTTTTTKATTTTAAAATTTTAKNGTTAATTKSASATNANSSSPSTGSSAAGAVVAAIVLGASCTAVLVSKKKKR